MNIDECLCALLSNPEWFKNMALHYENNPTTGEIAKEVINLRFALEMRLKAETAK